MAMKNGMKNKVIYIATNQNVKKNYIYGIKLKTHRRRRRRRRHAHSQSLNNVLRIINSPFPGAAATTTTTALFLLQTPPPIINDPHQKTNLHRRRPRPGSPATIPSPTTRRGNPIHEGSTQTAPAPPHRHHPRRRRRTSPPPPHPRSQAAPTSQTPTALRKGETQAARARAADPQHPV